MMNENAIMSASDEIRDNIRDYISGKPESRFGRMDGARAAEYVRAGIQAPMVRYADQSAPSFLEGIKPEELPYALSMFSEIRLALMIGSSRNPLYREVVEQADNICDLIEGLITDNPMVTQEANGKERELSDKEKFDIIMMARGYRIFGVRTPLSGEMTKSEERRMVESLLQKK